MTLITKYTLKVQPSKLLTTSEKNIMYYCAKILVFFLNFNVPKSSPKIHNEHFI